MPDEREILGWDLFGSASRELAQLVADDGYLPEMILSIARGGLLVGGALGYALGVKNVYTMNVEFYTGVDVRLEGPRILPPAPALVDLEDAHPPAGARLRRPRGRAHPDRRRRGGHGAHARERGGVLRGQGRGSARRRALR